LIPTSDVQILPASAERWADIETLFGAHGAFSGCWCMYWRVRHTEFNQIKGEGAREALKALTAAPIAPGVLAYLDGQPAGWCSIAPRENYLALERSRILKPVDDQPVWSVVCFYVPRKFRQQGMMTALLRGAVSYAQKHVAKIIEGYPTDMQAPLLEGKHLTGYHGFMGIAAAFREAGFVEVATAAEGTQLIMRYTIA
jgi:GNAT superfamily N-acetyltransferase